MKQKLSLVCALVPEPHVLLLDEPTTGVDPVSRREFWDALAHLAADGLTIVVATPYLDEAERCHRVALMHLGEIRQIGTPAELRASMHAKRLELRTANLGEAERSALRDRGPRQGDHRRAAIRRPAGPAGAPIRTRRSACSTRALSAAGLAIDDIRVDEPTLENTFVATLREPGPARCTTRRFPGATITATCAARSPSAPPISPSNSVTSPPSRMSASSALRRDLRPAGRQRRGQDHHHQDAVRPARRPPRATCNWREQRAQVCARKRCGSRSATCRRNSRSTTT